MTTLSRFLNDSRTITLAGLIFVLAYAIRVALVIVLRYYKSDLDLDSEISRVAAQFSQDFAFANPYVCPTGPTAHIAPGFPMILGMIYRSFPGSPAREIAECLLGTGVSSATYALLPWLAGSLGFERIVGVIAGFLGAMVPLFFWIEARGIWDASYACLFLTLCVAATVGLGPGRTLWRIAASGMLWGVAFWFSPSLLPVFAVCAGIVFWRWLPLRRAVAAMAVFSVPAFAIASPWMVRNYMQFHSVFWMRDNFGLELHTSNNPGARAIEVDNREHTTSFEVHPNSRPAVCAVVQRVGEVWYFKEQKRQALEWIASDPAAFVKLTMTRTFYFWFLPLNSPTRRAALAFLTVACFAGLVLLWKTHGVRILFAVLLAYSAIYCIVQIDPRYRYPIYPLTLTGASAVACFWARAARLSFPHDIDHHRISRMDDRIKLPGRK